MLGRLEPRLQANLEHLWHGGVDGRRICRRASTSQLDCNIILQSSGVNTILTPTPANRYAQPKTRKQKKAQIFLYCERARTRKDDTKENSTLSNHYCQLVQLPKAGFIAITLQTHGHVTPRMRDSVFEEITTILRFEQPGSKVESEIQVWQRCGFRRRCQQP